MTATSDNGHTSDFFISYTAADRQWAEWIAWQLQGAGYTVFLQAWNFVPGRDFLHEMERATSSAHRTIAILSRDYAESAFGEAEWRVAFAKDPSGEKGLLLPIKVTPCEPPSLLTSRIYIDLSDKTAAEAKEVLLAGINGKGIRPTSEPAFPGQLTRPPMFPGDTGPRHERLRPHADGRIRFPEGRTAVYFSDKPVRGAAIATDRYDTLRELLDDLYVSYLRDQFPPFTYGDKWILVEGFSARCVVPLAWLSTMGSPVHTIVPEWRRLRPSDAGIYIDQAFRVVHPEDRTFCGGIIDDSSRAVRPEDREFFGVITDDSRVLDVLESGEKAQAYISSYHSPTLSLENALEAGRYQAVFHAIFADTKHLAGKVFDLRGRQGAGLIELFLY